MSYKEIEKHLINGKIGLLPHYVGYFHWDWGNNKPYMINRNYKTYDISEEMKRNDWYYII